MVLQMKLSKDFRNRWSSPSEKWKLSRLKMCRFICHVRSLTHSHILKTVRFILAWFQILDAMNWHPYKPMLYLPAKCLRFFFSKYWRISLIFFNFVITTSKYVCRIHKRKLSSISIQLCSPSIFRKGALLSVSVSSSSWTYLYAASSWISVFLRLMTCKNVCCLLAHPGEPLAVHAVQLFWTPHISSYNSLVKPFFMTPSS